ncbi:MAG: hypothetical protein I8H75_03865 [Myxococcaceae bacterium]|nr:hypothetical protein [Myxococcaceae bacterium]MBH2006464.1 hypothetical protein [Myxococcaceae bacterium]
MFSWLYLPHIVLRVADENGEKLILDRDTISRGVGFKKDIQQKASVSRRPWPFRTRWSKSMKIKT